MVINMKKTHAMLFNRSRNFDFPPALQFQDGSLVEIVSETTLLGVKITDNLKWRQNTSYICLKARQKLWTLKRMQSLHLNKFELFDVYTKEIRSILEYAAPVWHASISKKEKSEIESIQKFAFKIILQNKYTNYYRACALFQTVTLEQRRQEICKRFAIKNLKSKNSMFEIMPTDQRLRNKSIKVKEYKCHTKQFQRSSIPYLATVINQSGLKGTLA